MTFLTLEKTVKSLMVGRKKMTALLNHALCFKEGKPRVSGRRVFTATFCMGQIDEELLLLFFQTRIL